MNDFYNNIIADYYNNIENESIKYTCYNCQSIEPLLYNQLNHSNVCTECGYESYLFEKVTFIKKKYYYINNQRDIIQKKLLKINNQLPIDKKLSSNDIENIIDLYIDIKKIINIVTGRKNIFVDKFIFSRLLLFINRSDVLDYIDTSLSMPTYRKYYIQWNNICNQIHQKFDMNYINLKIYPKLAL